MPTPQYPVRLDRKIRDAAVEKARREGTTLAAKIRKWILKDLGRTP